MKKAPGKKNHKSEIPLSKLKLNGSDVWILGTAHVSPESVQDVKDIYKTLKPDVVCVELCASRYDAMRDPDRWRKLDLTRVIKEKKLGLLASSLILSSFQKKIGKTTGVQPGQEMLTACDLAEKDSKELVLADRDVRTTLLRAWRQVGFFSKMWLSSALFSSLLVREEIPPEEIERMKKEDVLSDLFSALPSRYRFVKEIIVDERDQFLAGKIKESVLSLTGKNKKKKAKVFAVVGAGHLAGIEE
ncbi:MAG: TraB domain-containing protein, partial [Spirochaetia bacterium]|nr:TraB domain-containing protein [Spirochaetia bacterium]